MSFWCWLRALLNKSCRSSLGVWGCRTCSTCRMQVRRCGVSSYVFIKIIAFFDFRVHEVVNSLQNSQNLVVVVVVGGGLGRSISSSLQTNKLLENIKCDSLMTALTTHARTHKTEQRTIDLGTLSYACNIDISGKTHWHSTYQIQLFITHEYGSFFRIMR